MKAFARGMAGVLFAALAANGAMACSEETDPQMFDALQIAKIKKSAGKTHFHDTQCDAGAKGLDACRRKAFVMPGDVLLLGDIYDTTACATFVDAKGRATSGIIKGDRVEHDARGESKKATALVGRWVREEALITVTRKGDDFVFAGEATYGGKDPRRVAMGSVNSGVFDFVTRPVANRISVGLKDGEKAVAKSEADATDCHLDMIALGPYLVVRDNQQCGGMNVSFTGIYRKR
ncbi:MAG TPA: hypothetical protein PK970_03065 [Hyphomicrobiaceae bacterium]|nr:hypothetical protein [Hyphomicrobiaceae bacterium]